MRVYGNTLPEDSMHITLKGDGTWNAFPCLFKETTSVTEALSDYYTYATPGDMLKSHDHFAVFSQNKRWEGDLTAVRPGEGYMFRRLGSGSVDVRFFNKTSAAAPSAHRSPLTAHRYATNMTMIAMVEGLPVTGYGLRAYIGDELVGVATKIDSLYFLTISSDAAGTLRFETDNGERLMVVGESISYVADSHHGSLRAPIILRPTDDRPYKIIENNHVIIIRNNEKYDITGKKL